MNQTPPLLLAIAFGSVGILAGLVVGIQLGIKAAFARAYPLGIQHGREREQPDQWQHEVRAEVEHHVESRLRVVRGYGQ